MLSFSEGLFFVFTAMAVGASLGVIFSKNPVRSVLCLVWAFVATAAVWLLAQAEFLAIVLVLVYVGAVMVLFLFVVMMLDSEEEIKQPSLLKWLPLALLGGGGLLLALLKWIWQSNADTLFLPFVSVSSSNVTQIGQLLFTDYILAFEVAGVVLLVAIVAAIALTFRGQQGSSKKTDPALQVLVSKAGRLKIVSMPSEERS